MDADTPYILSCNEMRQFWVSYEMGLLQLGTGEVYTNDFLSWKLEGMSPLQRISIATDNKIGLWEVAQDLGRLMAQGFKFVMWWFQVMWFQVCNVMALSYNKVEGVNLYPTLGANIGPQLSLRWSCESCHLACSTFHKQFKSMLLFWLRVSERHLICLTMHSTYVSGLAIM